MAYINGNEVFGFVAGRDAAYKEGVKAERKRFFDRYLLFKKRGTWDTPMGVFHGMFWGFDNFYPTCDIKPVGNATYLFYNWNTEHGGKSGSLKQRLEECGVVLDTSKATCLKHAFAYSAGITELPAIDFTGITQSTTTVFAHCYSGLKTIEKIIVNENTVFSSWFTNTNIANVRFEGVIANDLSFSYSTRLTADSMKSIISCLSDTSTEKTLTLSQTAVNKANTNGDFGGDTVYMTTDGAGAFGYLESNPILLNKGQTIKVTFEQEDGHDDYNDYTDWWFCSAGTPTTGGTPNWKSGWTYTALDNENVVLWWMFSSDIAVSNIPIKIRAVLVDEDGNEIDGENLHSFVTNTHTTGGATLTIAEESWDTLVASKPNWTISLV